MSKIKDKHFKYFKKCCREYIDKLHLNDWEIDITLGKAENFLETTSATCYHTCGSSRYCEISLNPDYPGNLTKDSIRATAIHEVLHLLLADIFNDATSSKLGQEQKEILIERDTHAVIARLIPLIDKK